MVEKLEMPIEDFVAAVIKKNARLIADNDRLRAALKEINRMANSLSGPDLVLNSIAREARAALEVKA